MIGEGSEEQSNIVRLVMSSVQRKRNLTDKNGNYIADTDGNLVTETYIDDLSLWCKTLMVASNQASQVVYETMELVRDLERAFYNMPKERAIQWQTEGLKVVESVKKTLDTKSGESVLDKNNKQSTLVDKVNRSTSDRTITMKGDETKGKIARMMGWDKDEE